MESIDKHREMTNEDARTMWESITMNLAFLLAKIRMKNGKWVSDAADWLDE